MALQTAGSGVPASTVVTYMERNWESSLYANFELWDNFKDAGAVRVVDMGEKIRAPILITLGTAANYGGSS